MIKLEIGLEATLSVSVKTCINGNPILWNKCLYKFNNLDNCFKSKYGL